MNKKKIIILLCLIIPVVTLCIVTKLCLPDHPTQVQISINNEVYGTYPLYQDTTITIKNDDDLNIMQIKNGKVSVKKANCSNQICVNTNAISADNPSTIICMPHHLVIELK